MFDISNLNNFLLINTTNSYIKDSVMLERLCSILYAKSYEIQFLKSYKGGEYSSEILAIPNESDSINKDLNFLL